ncbi:replication protein A 70 kDa DNA-binding subunit B-like [Lactuca sativa]|uniref:replication protein A 70 kDa DNA-binding subunit B-like n=1 Tax=Lactuca sativa TaxID=4236 RepID=UPI0022AE866D|nr:replication protein A 70 kDa DNA-binding subunit B-like [Lactuca sativa]
MISYELMKMNIGNKVYLKNIDQIDEKSHIKVRVLNIWNFVRNNKVDSIEMIMMDEGGTQYHARVFNQNFSRFRHLLKEDESYIVIKPNMAAVTNGFSYTGHKQTLTLDWKSILKKCDDFSGPVNGFMFVDFNSIIEQTCPRDTFFVYPVLSLVVDVIGQIVSFRPLETSNPVASKHYMKLTLSNLDSVHLKVTIFGSQAYQMSEYLKNNPTVNCVVIVMQFLKLNIWNDIGEAKSHFEVTKLLISSNIYEINEFKNNITTLQSYSSSYTDDFKGNFLLKTVCEITEPIKEMKFLLVASIVNIRQNLPWYYEACNKCGKKITPVPKTNHLYTDPEKISETIVVKCTNAQCKKSEIQTIIKYIIPINVQDCAGTIGLTLFDREAKRPLNISAYELKKIHEAAGDSDGLFPMQLNVLKNRKFGFVVDIIEYNVNNYNNIYTVLRVIEDMSIVFESESKIELMSIQSVSLNQVALESDDVVQPVQKDVISQTNESFSPSTVDKSIATSSSKISNDLKRNLQEIYDVESRDDLSSTKAKRKSTGEETPLIIPKMEK